LDYRLELRKFISSQYLYAGLRITAGVIIPAALLYHYGLLTSMIAIPLGALFVSLADSPGPIAHRRMGIFISIVLNSLVVLIAGYSRVSPFMIGVEIILFGIFFSLIAIYGNRANSIGLIALIVFILNIDASNQQPVLQQALYITIGGAWYAVLSLSLHTLRPYRPIQQLLGELLMETAVYLRTRAMFYEKSRDEENIFKQLMLHQVHIHTHQDELREMLFTTRRVLSESTRKGRVLMMSFLDSIDLMERIMTSQQDYALLHETFDDSNILDEIRDNIVVLANELHHIGLAVQGGYVYSSPMDLDSRLKQSMDAFTELRSKKLKADNVESFISIRHIIYSLEDITERIKRLQAYTTYDKKLSKQYKRDVDVEQFVNTQEINFNLLLDNLSLKSGTFRHALRITCALLAGYIASLLFPLGHGYWILLTIAVIMKPAYSITRRRNYQRLIGTFTGAAIGFPLLFFIDNTTALFLIMVASMIVSYSLLKLEYTVSSITLTIAVLIMFRFLSPLDLKTVITDRIIDTAIGSTLAYLVATFVLPAWEYEQIEEFAKNAIESNKKYFLSVAGYFTGNAPDITNYKIARKDAFVALANLSDIFQRMLSEPKSQQPKLPQYHQFVTASHMLSSYIASLSYNASRFGTKYAQEDFKPMVREIEKRFSVALSMMENGQVQLQLENTRLPIHKKVQVLLEQRKKEISEGIENDAQSIRKTLSELKTITDQFQLIYANLNDQTKIIAKLKGTKNAD
jgi:uncharacterized membrane protein (TIGR01666 family)